MAEPTNTNVANRFVLVEPITDPTVVPEVGCQYGRIAAVGNGVDQVNVYQLVLYKKTTTPISYKESAGSFTVIEQSDIILVTPYDAPP